MLDVAEAVLLRELRHHFALAEVPLIFGRRPHELVRHQLQHVMHRALARRLVDDRAHLLGRQQRAVFALLRGNRRHGQQACACGRGECSNLIASPRTTTMDGLQTG